MEKIARCDMHVHSCFSKEKLFYWDENTPPRLWYDKIIYSIYRFVMRVSRRTAKKRGAIYFFPVFNPKELYDIAKKRGMDFFTVTDHDSLESYYWLIKKYPNLKNKVIPGVELTSRIRGRQFQIHIGIFGLNNKQFKELKLLAGDVENVVKYCKKNNLICSLNHISNTFIQQLSTNQGKDIMLKDDADYLIRLFDYLEIRNGLAEEKENQKAEIIAKKYNKKMLGGSDSHIGQAGVTWTGVRARTKEEFLNGLKKGKSFVGGVHGGYASTRRELVSLVDNYSGLYYSDFEKVFDWKIDFWSKGYFRGLIFLGIEKIVQLLTRASSPFTSRWAHNRL